MGSYGYPQPPPTPPPPHRRPPLCIPHNILFPVIFRAFINSCNFFLLLLFSAILPCMSLCSLFLSASIFVAFFCLSLPLSSASPCYLSSFLNKMSVSLTRDWSRTRPLHHCQSACTMLTLSARLIDVPPLTFAASLFKPCFWSPSSFVTSCETSF